MAQLFSYDSPTSSDARLGNRSSDDSLILDDGNTSGIWADNETEPATFQVAHTTDQASYFSSHSNSSAVDNRGEWHRGTWSGHPPEASVNQRSLHHSCNVSMPTRLSLTGEDSEVPLLSSERWSSAGEPALSMRHCHSSSVASSNDSAWRRLMCATVLCLFFMIAEVLGGIFAGSVAVMTDAAHLLSDFVGLLVSLSAVWLGQRPPTKTLSFGFHRAEVLGALFSIFVIWLLTGIFVYIAILRLVHGDIHIRADRMMAVAAGGIVINIIMGVILHGGCQQINVPHSHGFGHHQHLHENSGSHDEGNLQHTPCVQHRSLSDSEGHLEDHTISPGRNHSMSKRSNINVRAAAIHVLGDLIQSIGVFIAAVVIKFNPDAKIADPICTFLFAIVVLATTIPLLRDTGLVLLEGFPQSIAYNQVFSVLRDIPGVKHVHSLHVWSLTIGKHALSVHLAIDPVIDRDDVTLRAQHILQAKFGIQICTIQTECFDQTAINSCVHCKPLKD